MDAPQDGISSGDGSTSFGTIFTIVLEDHDYQEIVGSSHAPKINALIDQYGLATNYSDSITHPSLPNYLYLISGDIQYPGFIDIGPTELPYFPASGDNLGHQMDVAGIAWRSYQESAGGTCVLSNNGNYVAKHDPFLYFSDIQNNAVHCQATNVDLGLFASDLALGQYRYMWITPNLVSDGNVVDALGNKVDPVTALTTSDTWVGTMVSQIMASAAYQQNGVIFITWDEAEGRNGDAADQVPLIVISPKLKSSPIKINTALSHASYRATIETIFGLPKLGAAASATDLMGFFQ